MRKASSIALIVICACLTVILAGCGSSSSHATSTQHATPTQATSTAAAPASTVTQAASVTPLPPGTAAIVGTHKITNTMLAQWMAEQAGEDYFQAGHNKLPAGLVSEPANIPACLALLQTPGKAAGQTRAQLKETCERLYKAIKKQTLQYLVSSYWALDFAAAHGITITNTEIKQALDQFKASQYPTNTEFQRDLTARTRTLQQELFIVRNDLVSRKLLTKLAAGPNSPIGKEALNNAETATCPPEYTVEHCKGYHPTTTPSPHPSAAVMLEEITRWLNH